MNKIAILYGSTAGTTGSVAKQMAGLLEAAVFNVADNPSDEQLSQYDILIIGTSTWGDGELQDDWIDFLPVFTKYDLQKKTVALFALGDSSSYPDTFVNAMGEIYDSVKGKCLKIIGFVDTKGYKFDGSSAVVDGKFVGLPLDEDNESLLTGVRLKRWLEQIMSEINETI